MSLPKPTPNISDSVLEMFSLKGKVAAISGAASGIGYQVARAYAEAGAGVAMFYNSNKNAIEKAAALAKEFNVKVIAYQVPLNTLETVEKGFNQVVKDFGKLDIVVANAGTMGGGNIVDMSVERWKQITDVNFNSVFFVAKVAGTIFKKQGHGNLIVTSSMSGHIINVPINQAAYNASKAGVRHFAKSLAVEFKEFARVNTVSPGFVMTDMGAEPEVVEPALRKTALGRQADPRELKGVYLLLASDASTYMTGTDIIIDGGYTLP